MRAHYIAFNVPGAPKSATPKPFLKHRKAAQSPFGLLALFLALFLAHKIAHKSQGRGVVIANKKGPFSWPIPAFYYTFPGSISVSYYKFLGSYRRILLHPWAWLFITKRRHQPGRNLTGNFYNFYGYLRLFSPKSSPKTRAPNVTERPKEPPKEPGETYTIYTPYASFRELLWELEGLTMIYDEFLFIEKVCSEV